MFVAVTISLKIGGAVWQWLLETETLTICLQLRAKAFHLSNFNTNLPEKGLWVHLTAEKHVPSIFKELFVVSLEGIVNISQSLIFSNIDIFIMCE